MEAEKLSMSCIQSQLHFRWNNLNPSVPAQILTRAQSAVGYIMDLLILMILVGSLMPVGLGFVINMPNINVTNNGAEVPLSDVMDPTLLGIIVIVLPIGALIGILYMFIPKIKGARR